MTQARQAEPMLSTEQTADILLVEDDPHDAELTIRALEQSGFAHRIEHVTDGDEALDYIASLTLFVNKHTVKLPRLILLDLKLHATGGLHVLQRLKSDERTKGIPITVLTASKLAIEVVESYKLGVNSYVLKPQDGGKFAEVVGAVSHYWLSINEPPPV
jgi:CheY-like chemotaxis protein